ncbi:glycogen synthase GlgA [Roseomonas xinghualingensis]|uniref:glycogen synthase GlgA n=1 Tax=Roseomonas xinghualingensis TaxID=2986475 RepID=UPI0021F1E8CC|nr:glycogen synthase GlgA [Roseomonas sp. SXEYE001]MCV4208409.1 glycogen synthase GlgA [Roseomonas sp. SXEYE001]
MRVLSVASECFPLIKTGGLADVVGALPAALAPEAVAVRTLLPGYPEVIARAGAAGPIHVFDDLFGDDLFGGPARLLAVRMAGLDLLILDAPHLYARPGGPYSDPQGRDWPDNPRRFAALSWAAAEIGRGALPGWVPQVVHAHDWQAGLAPAYLHYGAAARPGTVFTVHNLAFQGQCDASLLSALRLPREAWNIDGVEYYGSIGTLKAGLRLSDRITTVSPTYAREITTPAEGMGLDGLLRARSGVLHGILNGIDEAAWDPARDPHLAAPFDAGHLEGRETNRMALRARMGLDGAPEALVVGVVTRLTGQKGMDLLLEALPALLGHGMSLALLGAGEPRLEAGFQAAAAAHPGRIGIRIGYDESLAHLIQGGCDALLVPSRFEPCGLTQLCALRYGALPVVARVGGLADTVIDANEAALAAGVATGVQFAPTTGPALESALARLAALWRDRGVWATTQANALHAPVGWARSAARYAALYREVTRTA